MLLIATLLRWSETPASAPRKLASLLAGVLFFLGLLPALLSWAGSALGVPPATVPPLAAALLIVSTTSLGLSWLAWATLTQWKIGRGTPAPMAPTQRLVIQGPYRLSRNPIEFGAVLYYLGFGALFATPGAGLFAAAVALAAGSAYHRFVEEHELLIRFGDDYRRYRERTPFLVPDLMRLFESPRR
jgi:protein-S-isoprenylcysteine O-methyltransferase Ste14